MKGEIFAVRSWASCCTHVVAALAIYSMSCCAQAQLAITEVMADDLFTDQRVQGADFWELTNFGTTPIDLTGFSFTDRDHELFPLPSQGLWIGPGESILFIQTNATMNETRFREWWKLPPDLPVVRPFDRPGLSSKVDSVRLYDASAQLVDRVDFGLSRTGHSFTYETNGPNSGVLCVITSTGMCQAVESLNGSVGSPGTTCGPLPLQFWRQPTDLVVTAGMDAEFVVRASGMPRPKYQWQLDGSPLPGATAEVLAIPNAQAANAGTYQVLVTNGIQNLLSTTATLTILTNPSAPYFVSRPSDQTVFTGQTARFRSVVAGYPPSNLQWSCNGQQLLGETDRVLVIPDCTLAMSGSTYCLTASNEWGSTSACAVLTVTPKPDLRITEVMARRLNNQPEYHDWFEVTNYETNRVNLQGYRYGMVADLEQARVIVGHVIIKPGESIIFADVLTRDEFMEWWGRDNLPEDLQVITWTGFGISAKGGETVFLWGPNTEDPSDVVAQVFTDVSTDRVSRGYDTNGCPMGCDSVPGEGGAFFAINGGEIGSPGYVSNPPLRFIGIQLGTGGILLKGRSIVGTNYALLSSTNLYLDRVPSWDPITNQVATNATVYFGDVRGTGSKFYRLEQLP